jgi:hypothetical protein
MLLTVATHLVALITTRCIDYERVCLERSWETAQAGECLYAIQGCDNGRPFPCTCQNHLVTKQVVAADIPHVVGLAYVPPGNTSQVSYLSCDAKGSRTVVFDSAGQGAAVRLGPVTQNWAVTAVTGASESTHVTGCGGYVTHGNGYGHSDLSHDLDEFSVWVNARATVTEADDEFGNHYSSVNWSSTGNFPSCGSSSGIPLVYPITAGKFRQSPGTLTDACARDVIQFLVQKNQEWAPYLPPGYNIINEDILGLDPFFRWTTPPFGTDPELQERFVRPCRLLPGQPCCQSLTAPSQCASSATDTIPIQSVYFAASQSPSRYLAGRSTCSSMFGGGFVEQDLTKSRKRRFVGSGKQYTYGAASFAVDTTCRALVTDDLLNSATDGCWMSVDVYFDREFGALVFNPPSSSNISPSCRR